MVGFSLRTRIRLVGTMVLGLFVSIVSPSIVDASPRVLGIRHWSAPTYTRVVLDLTDKISFRVFLLRSPPRLVVDLREVLLADPSLKGAVIGGPIVQRVRLSQHGSSYLRVVLDLSSLRIRHRAFLLEAMEGRPHRMVIDVRSPELESKMAERRRVMGRSGTQQGQWVVVIDPGHGGEDPGAVGRRGTKEKDVVLKIGRELARRLNRRPGIRAFLTRKGDYYLSLSRRVAVAQDYGADLFISIHADASLNRRVRGASVYCLSLKGATDEAARILAEKENASDLIAGVPRDEDPDLNRILLDLVQTRTINESLKWGGLVLKELRRAHRLRYSVPKQAGFRVLKAPEIPSLLVEVGFITNPTEEKLLRMGRFQGRIAQALEEGICRYLCTGGPDRTREANLALCESSKPRAHVVKPGQSLSQIAALYHTSIRDLMEINRIQNASLIYPGQRILIP